MFKCICNRNIGEESYCKEIFEEYVERLQEKAKEKERKREEEKVTEVRLSVLVFEQLSSTIGLKNDPGFPYLDANRFCIESLIIVLVSILVLVFSSS